MQKIDLVLGLLDTNEELAKQNRILFEKNGVYVINLMGVPGAGKTTVLEQIIIAIKDEVKIGVVEGDLYTTKDAQRIEKLGVPTVQINTKGACHLDAATVRKACMELPLADIEVLFIENIGNLVCPAEFNLGEDLKAMVLSVNEGNDKPWKYPLMFRESSVIMLNKIDLLTYTDFDIEEFYRDIKQINPKAKVFPISARAGTGIDDLSGWLKNNVKVQKQIDGV